MGRPQVIFNADDFGSSPDINAAVMRAHRQGVLTSASLMVTGQAVDEAVALAREAPRLAVGLHLVLVRGRSVLSPREIRHLVDEKGRFSYDPVRAGLYYCRILVNDELAREIGAQFERFAATGLSLSHVDGHLNMHLHPAVLPVLLPLARRFGAQGFRLPRDDLGLALRADRHGLAGKAALALVFEPLCRWCLERLREHGLAFADRVYGLLQSGRMHEAYVLRILEQLKVTSAELYFHPSLSYIEPSGPNPDDLTTLLSPAVRQMLESRALVLATYPSLRGSASP